MTQVRRRSLEIPVDDEGMLGRECPRCQSKFKIDLETYENRGFMNLRCPSCEFISELDNFTTGEQRRYLYSVSRNFALSTIEDLIEDVFDGGSSASTGGVEIEVTTDDVNFSRVETEPPTIGTNLEEKVCDECGFSFQKKVGSDGVCPVCR
jgi:phage FluMu protein Com